MHDVSLWRYSAKILAKPLDALVLSVKMLSLFRNQVRIVKLKAISTWKMLWQISMLTIKPFPIKRNQAASRHLYARRCLYSAAWHRHHTWLHLDTSKSVSLQGERVSAAGSGAATRKIYAMEIKNTWITPKAKPKRKKTLHSRLTVHPAAFSA